MDDVVRQTKILKKSFVDRRRLLYSLMTMATMTSAPSGGVVGMSSFTELCVQLMVWSTPDCV